LKVELKRSGKCANIYYIETHTFNVDEIPELAIARRFSEKINEKAVTMFIDDGIRDVKARAE